MSRLRKLILLSCWLLTQGSITPSYAAMQEEEKLAPSVAAALQRAISDTAAPKLVFDNPAQGQAWLAEMSRRLTQKIPDEFSREQFLITVQYEATRAGLDPEMVLGLIQVESNFRKYAISNVNAKGYMQVMPFWVRYIGSDEHNLFHLRTNLRYGCTILRHYLDMEKGNLYLALGRYNGSRGKATYPNLILNAWQNYKYASNTQASK